MDSIPSQEKSEDEQIHKTERQILKKKTCLSANSTEFCREKTVLQLSIIPQDRNNNLSWNEKQCIFAPSLMPWALGPPNHHLPTTATPAGREVAGQVGYTCKCLPPNSGIRMFSCSQLHEKENAMQIMMDYMKIIQRMLSTSLTDSCQNILPSSFLTHHFQATSLILKTRTVPHHVSCKRVKNFSEKGA